MDQRTFMDGLNLGDTEGWVNSHGSSVSHRMTLRGRQREHEVPVVRDRRLEILPGQRDEAEVTVQVPGSS